MENQISWEKLANSPAKDVLHGLRNYIGYCQVLRCGVMGLAQGGKLVKKKKNLPFCPASGVSIRSEFYFWVENKSFGI